MNDSVNSCSGVSKGGVTLLRNTSPSLMHKMGMSPKEIQDYLGHSTVSVTLNIYTHLDWSNKKNATKAMEGVIKVPEGLNSNKFTNSDG